MAESPPSYSDLGKDARDLFTKDYSKFSWDFRILWAYNWCCVSLCNVGMFAMCAFCNLSSKSAIVNISVVTTTEVSLPQRWLATTEPTPLSRCFTVFSAAFLGAISWSLPLTSAGTSSLRQSSDSHLNSTSFDPCMNARWVVKLAGDTPALLPRACIGFPTPPLAPGQQGQSRHCTWWYCHNGFT